MDFTFTSEQRQLADSVRRWVDKDYGFEQRRSTIHLASGVSDAAWATLVELGLTALPVPEAHGGFGGGPVDMLAVLQEFGRGLLVEPYLATVMGAHILALAGTHGALLERVAAGELKLACALAEAQARHDLADIVTSAVKVGGGFILDGCKSVVVHGGQAGAFIVSSRTGGGQREQGGITLFVVPADTPGLTVRDYRTIDGQRAATVTLAQVAVPHGALLGPEGGGWDLLDAGADYGAGLLCFEALGALDALFAATLEYLKTRTQFGAPIGKFQVLQHRMADMYIHLEQARSMALLVAVKLSSDDAAERRSCVSAAKFRIGQALTFIGQQAVQLHGGMGVTDELPAAHLFKRLTIIGLTLGDTDHHLERFIAQPEFLPLPAGA